MNATDTQRDARLFGRSLLITVVVLILIVCAAWLVLRNQTSVYSPIMPDHPTQAAGLGLMLQPNARESGLYVLAVTEHGAASEAGILPGDLVTEANGTALTAVTELDTLLATLPAEQPLILRLRRKDAAIDVTLLDEP